MKPVFTIVFIMAIIYAVVLFVVAVKCELPTGMYQATYERADTLWDVMHTPSTRTLDSLTRVSDSLELKIREIDIKKREKRMRDSVLQYKRKNIEMMQKIIEGFK